LRRSRRDPDVRVLRLPSKGDTELHSVLLLNPQRVSREKAAYAVHRFCEADSEPCSTASAALVAHVLTSFAVPTDLEQTLNRRLMSQPDYRRFVMFQRLDLLYIRCAQLACGIDSLTLSAGSYIVSLPLLFLLGLLLVALQVDGSIRVSAWALLAPLWLHFAWLGLCVATVAFAYRNVRHSLSSDRPCLTVVLWCGGNAGRQALSRARVRWDDDSV
jgi:hypothetical protein